MSKTILVTGASRGIGLSCARILLDKFNCNVVTLSRSLTDELQALKKEYNDRIEIVQGDVVDVEDQKVRKVMLSSLVSPGCLLIRVARSDCS